MIDQELRCLECQVPSYDTLDISGGSVQGFQGDVAWARYSSGRGGVQSSGPSQIQQPVVLFAASLCRVASETYLRHDIGGEAPSRRSPS